MHSKKDITNKLLLILINSNNSFLRLAFPNTPSLSPSTLNFLSPLLLVLNIKAEKTFSLQSP